MGRVGVIGGGYVGLVTAACLAEGGHRVACAERDLSRLEQLLAGGCPVREPGLAKMVRRNAAQNRLRFVESARAASEGSDVVIVAVGTPVLGSGRPDVRAVREAVLEAGRATPSGAVIAVKSTVPAGFTDDLEGDVWRLTGRADVSLVVNPEFLRQGSAVHDFLRPSRIVVGAADSAAAAKLLALYGQPGATTLVVSRRSAELAKLATNAYLASRLSFVNEVSEVCEAAGADVEEVRRCLCSGERVGGHYFEPGLGFGGSCLPKDLAMLRWFAATHEVEVPLLGGVERRNVRQAERTVDLALALTRRGQVVAQFGLAFKPGTDDVRGSVGVHVAKALSAAGRKVRAHDPLASGQADADGVLRTDTPEEAADDASVLIIATAWEEYRGLDWAAMRKAVARPVVIDGPRLLSRELMEELGFDYFAPGHRFRHDVSCGALAAAGGGS